MVRTYHGTRWLMDPEALLGVGNTLARKVAYVSWGNLVHAVIQYGEILFVGQHGSRGEIVYRVIGITG